MVRHSHISIALLFVGTALPAAQAKDGMSASLGLFAFDQSAETPPPAADSAQGKRKVTANYTFLNVGICYVVNVVCIGAKYFDATVTTAVKTSASSNTTKATTEYKNGGVTLGYSEDFVATFTYFFDADKVTAASAGNASSAGAHFPAKTATMIDIGYGFKVKEVRVGPLLSQYTFSYSKTTVDGTTVTHGGTITDAFLVPQFALWLDF